MYNLYVDVAKSFKSSINLEYDLMKEDKILEYIPTSDLCDVLDYYLGSVLNNNNSRSTLLVGPYGKGKSYLMLILTYLLSTRSNRNLFNNIVSKIKNINENLYDKIIEIDNKNIALLPVLVNNSAIDDFNNSFMLAINNSLKEHNLSNLVPDSAYNEAVKIIKKWRKDNIILEKYLDLKEIENELKNYKLDAFNKFKKMYKDISYGLDFNPLINGDITKIYYDVSLKLKDYGYSGIFIIYDEFGVFLENQKNDFILKLNKLQSLAEKCNDNSLSTQMHLCLITHKDFVLYSKNKEESNDFAKIAGRFKTIKFNRSLEENYEIICDALKKKDKYNDIVTAFINDNEEFITALIDSRIIAKKDILNLIKGAFPFNPLAIYSLIKVSELVGQNERTLFTFLTDSSEFTFKYFIKNNETGLLNIDYIYEYFKDLIKNDNEYNKIIYKVYSIIKLTNDKLTQSIVKTLAVIKVINDDIVFPASLNNLALALNENLIDIKVRVDDLIKLNQLSYDSLTHYVNFSTLNDVSINEKINNLISTKLLNINIVDLLNEINENKYFISNQYNYEYEMTRFYEALYLDSKTFLNLKDTSNLNYIGDGLIINLIDEVDINIIKDKLISLNKPNLIIRIINRNISREVINKIKKIKAINILLNDKDIVESLSLHLKELKIEINKYFNYLLKNSLILNIVSEKNNLNEIIYESFRAYYGQTVKFINEQVNKENISAVANKARNKVGDIILGLKEKDFSNTSLEQTILNSFNDSINLDHIFIQDLIDFIANGNELSFVDLFNHLHDEPYGMRKGIMPLFIVYALRELMTHNRTFVIMHKNKELEINTKNISEALGNDYILKNLSFTKVEYEVLKDFNLALGNNDTTNFNQIVDGITSTLENDFYDFDSIIALVSEDDNILNLSDLEINYKDMLMKTDINNFSLVFYDLPKLFGVSIKELPSLILDLRKNLVDKANLYYNSLVTYVKNLLNTKDSLKEGFNNLFLNKSNILLNSEYKRLVDIINKSNNNDLLLIKQLAKVSTNSNISSFNSKKDNLFKETISNFINYFNSNSEENIEEDSINVNLSIMGETLLNNLEEVLDEYGMSITKEEKIAILKSLIKRCD